MEFASAWAHLSIFEILVWCVARAQTLPFALLRCPPSPAPSQSQEAWDVIGRRACSKGGRFLRGREEGLRRRKSTTLAFTNTGQSDGTDVRPICVSRLHVFCPRREKASFIFKQTSKSNYLHGGRVAVHFVFHVLPVISLWYEPSMTRGTYLVSGRFHRHSITHNNIIISMMRPVFLLQVSWGGHFISWFNVVTCWSCVCIINCLANKMFLIANVL